MKPGERQVVEKITQAIARQTNLADTLSGSENPQCILARERIMGTIEGLEAALNLLRGCDIYIRIYSE